MALVINAGTTGATGNHTTSGTTEVIASGAFGAASVQITVAADASEQAPVYTFTGPGAISVQAADGSTLYAEVVGGDSPAIDVAMNP